MSWDVSAFKEKLEDQHSFPGVYKFKFIVPKDKVDKVVDLLSGGEISQKPSSGGKYISVTSKASVKTSDEVIGVYEKASGIEGCIAL